MDYNKTKTRKYESLIRDIINKDATKYANNNSKKDLGINDYFSRLYGINSNLSKWTYLTSSLDTIGDSHMAIISFINQFNKSNNNPLIGDTYLKMYGVLNAVYIQFYSIYEISEIMKVNKIKEIEKNYKNLDINFLRNSIGAHPVNFFKKNIKENYTITRSSLKDFKDIEITSSSSEKKFNLIKSLDDYIVFSEELLYNTIEKIVRTRFKNNKENREKLLKKLKDIG